MTASQSPRATDSFDLFVTVSALRALAQLDAGVSDPAALAQQLRRAGLHRGPVGARRGQPADVWSTGYAVMIADRLHADDIDSSAAVTFLRDHLAATDETSNMWSVAIALEAVGKRATLRESQRVLDWIGSAQVQGGGMAWSHAHARAGYDDVRPTAFALRALDAAGLLDESNRAIDLDGVASFLLSAQIEGGGFTLNRQVSVPCVWASGEACDGLNRLGMEPHDSSGLIGFVDSLRTAGGYRRGEAYAEADLLSTRHALLVHSARNPPPGCESTLEFLRSCESDLGGFENQAIETRLGNAHDAAARILSDSASASDFNFLRSCVMHEEGGVAFLPARGPEVRSTQLAAHAIDLNAAAVGQWAAKSQTPGAGWGSHAGRETTAVATGAVIATLDHLGLIESAGIDVAGVVTWLEQAWATSTSLLDRSAAFHSLQALGSQPSQGQLDLLLSRCDTGGGWRSTVSTQPDLTATYQALLGHQALDQIELVLDRTVEWLGDLRRTGGYAWSSTALHAQAVPTALATLIERRATRQIERLPLLHI